MVSITLRLAGVGEDGEDHPSGRDKWNGKWLSIVNTTLRAAAEGEDGEHYPQRNRGGMEEKGVEDGDYHPESSRV